MYQNLDSYQQLLLAIEFHLSGATIPQELADLLGPELITDITNPNVCKGIADEHSNDTRI